jgi:excisionase family DNA binding protein
LSLVACDAIQRKVRAVTIKLSDLPELVTQRHAAKFFGVHFTTVVNWRKSGSIGFVRIGRGVRIPRSEIERLLREGAAKVEAKGAM